MLALTTLMSCLPRFSNSILADFQKGMGKKEYIEAGEYPNSKDAKEASSAVRCAPKKAPSGASTCAGDAPSHVILSQVWNRVSSFTGSMLKRRLVITPAPLTSPRLTRPP